MSQRQKEDPRKVAARQGSAFYRMSDEERDPLRAIRFALTIDDHFDRRYFLQAWLEGALAEWPEFKAFCEKDARETLRVLEPTERVARRLARELEGVSPDTPVLATREPARLRSGHIVAERAMIAPLWALYQPQALVVRALADEAARDNDPATGD